MIYIDHLSILVMLTAAMLFCRNMVGLGFALFYSFLVLIDWHILTLFDLQGRHWALIFGGFYATALVYMLVFVSRFALLKLAISTSVILLFSSPVLYYLYENYYVLVYSIFNNEWWSIPPPSLIYDIDIEVFWTTYDYIDDIMPELWLILVSMMVMGLVIGGWNDRGFSRRRLLTSFYRKYNHFYSNSPSSIQRAEKK